jgi:hypothetical protein
MPYWLYTMVGLMGWQLFQSTPDLMQLPPPPVAGQAGLLPLVLVPIAGSSQALVRFFLMFITYDRDHLLPSTRPYAACAEVPVLPGCRPTALRHARMGYQP